MTTKREIIRQRSHSALGFLRRSNTGYVRTRAWMRDVYLNILPKLTGGSSEEEQMVLIALQFMDDNREDFKTYLWKRYYAETGFVSCDDIEALVYGAKKEVDTA